MVACKSISKNSMAVATVVSEAAIPNFTERTPVESELECECRNILKLELSETVSELSLQKKL